MDAFEWIGLFGSLASIISLLLFFLEKKGAVSIKIHYKFIIVLICITITSIMIGIFNKGDSVTIIQENDNDHNNIEVLIPGK